MTPKISVIIPAYNAEKTIEKTLNAVLSQKFSKNKFEVIVVDDESTDNTINIIKKFKKVKLITKKHGGPASSRNLGVKKSKGKIILFTDSDCVPKKNWIKEMIGPFDNKKVAAVAGTYETLNNDFFMARFAGYEIGLRHQNMKKLDSIDFVGTYNCAFRKSIFLKYGGFNESFKQASGEDPELSFRIRESEKKIVFQPKSIVYHNHPDSLTKYLKQKYNRAFWKVLLYSYHPKKMFGDAYTPKTLFPQILITGLSIILFFLGFFYHFFFYVSFIFLFVSLLLNYDFYSFVWEKEKSMVVISPFIFLLRNIISIVAIIHGGIHFLFKKFNF